MNAFFLPLLLGFLLGLRHAFEPDHLAAVAALLGRDGATKGDAGRIGALWGAGHASTLLLAGSAVILLGWRIPAGLQVLFEGGVALVLILMGGSVLIRRLRGDRAHLHLHEHDGLVHAHLHFHHGEESDHRHHVAEGLFSPGRRPFLVGMIHGLSGSGGAALLVVSTSPSPAGAMGALALFGAGALAGMAILGRWLGLPLWVAARNSSALDAALRTCCGLASLLLGLSLALHTFRAL